MKLPISIFLILCSFYFGAMQLPAQSPCNEVSLPQEKIMLQLDRNVCLAGETLWFKAWCFLDGLLEHELSKVLYVEIFDENQKAIVQEKYLINNNTAEGSIRIPEDIPSKYYFLKAYTRYMRNFSSDDYHYQQITIVNPLIEGKNISAEVVNAVKGQTNAPVQTSISPPDVKHLKIELNKEKYQARERVNFHLESMQTLTAELATTVRLKGLGNRPTQEVMLQNNWLLSSCQEDPFCRQFYDRESLSSEPSNPEVQKKILPEGVHELQWRPETRGLTISGVLQGDTSDNMEGTLTMVAALQKEPMLYMGNTDEHGNFTICLHHMQNQKNLFVGTSDEKNKVLIHNDFDPGLPDVAAVPLQYDSTLHKLLESLNLHQQLDRTYPNNETQVVFEPKPLPIISTNILAPDNRLVLSDFISVPTMIEVFRDITTDIIIQKKDGKVNLSVFNFEEQKYYESPLILLDNVPVFDIPQLLEIDPAKVEAIEIYDSNYILGDHALGGIISIITKTDDFAGYEWEDQVAFTSFQAFSTPQIFEQVLHQEKSHYPDFRPVLYWQPELQMNQQQKSKTISIYAPDRPGIYEILVQGYTRMGEPCLGYITFEVVQSR